MKRFLVLLVLTAVFVLPSATHGQTLAQSSILSVSPNPASPGQTVTISGNKLNSQVSNMVEICNGSSCNNYGGTVSPDGTKIVFTMPNIPNGTYNLSVINLVTSQGSTNPIIFNVITPTPTQAVASIIGTPTLVLQYDSARKESKLTSSATVKITAGQSDFKVFGDIIWFPFIDSKGNSVSLNEVKNAFAPIYSAVPDNSVTVSTDQYGRTIYNIPAGTSATFTASATANPQQMFAGSYYSSLDQIYYSDPSNPLNSLSLLVPNNRTNFVTIVGEVSPYINTITSPADVGSTVTISGLRFSPKDSLVVDGTSYTLGKGNLLFLWSGAVFTPKLLGLGAGSHTVIISDPTSGNSNAVNLQLTGGVVPPPTTGPSASIIGTPTLTLQYDSSQKESSLIGKATVQVNSGSSELDIPISGPYLTITNAVTGGGGDVPNNNQSITSLPTTNLATGQRIPGLTYYIIPANKSVQFQITRTMNPQQMFAGQYYAYVAYVNNVGSTNVYGSIPLPPNSPISNKVTIVGELSPYINSVTDSVKAGDTMTITGTRFSVTTLLLIDGQNVTVGVTGNASSMSFVVPSSWVSGSHFIEVSNSYGKSNRAYFTVTGNDVIQPKVSLIGTPTLALQFDSSKKESALVATAKASVTAGSSDLHLQAWAPFYLSINTVGKLLYNINLNSDSTVFTPSINLSTGGDNITVEKYYIIPAGTTVQFTMVRTLNPQQMFAGQYQASVTSYNVLDNNSNNLSNNSLPSNLSNAVTIVGEVSPYINSVTSPTNVSNKVTVFGVRFNARDSIIVDGAPYGVGKGDLMFIGSGLAVFTPKLLGLSAGSHVMVVSDPTTGNSNSLNFQLTGTSPTPVQPPTTVTPVVTNTSSNTGSAAITVTSPNGGEQFTQGSNQNITWSAPGLSTVSIYILKNRLMTATIASNISNTGSYNWTVPNNLSGNDFQIYIAAAGVLPDDSDNTFTIVAPPTATAPVPPTTTAPITVPTVAPIPAPTITAITSPASVLKTVTITGTGFSLGQNVVIDGVNHLIDGSKISVQNGTTITFIPLGIGITLSNLGNHTVKVSGSSGVSNTVTLNLTVSLSDIIGAQNLALVISATVPDTSGSTVQASVPTSSCLSLPNDLQYPNTDLVTNGSVSKLQGFLHDNGYLGSAPTGNFGSDTFVAVKSFQLVNGIPSTGYVGAITRMKIQAVSCQ